MKIKIPAFVPLEVIPHRTWVVVAVVEAVFAVVLWQVAGGNIIPGPLRVAGALGHILSTPDFYDNLFSSLGLTLKGMGIAIVIALIITYLAVIPMFEPVAKFVSQCRYLTLTGLIFLFTLLTKDGGQLKISLLLFGIVPFFVTSLTSVLSSINKQEYELCTILRMNKIETVWEVVILGRLDQVLEVMRQNFAISWLMITMAEGYSMSEGGLGVMLIRSNKVLDLAQTFSILLIIFLMGIGFDVLLASLRRWFFPYCRLQVAK